MHAHAAAHPADAVHLPLSVAQLTLLTAGTGLGKIIAGLNKIIWIIHDRYTRPFVRERSEDTASERTRRAFSR